MVTGRGRGDWEGVWQLGEGVVTGRRRGDCERVW